MVEGVPMRVGNFNDSLRAIAEALGMKSLSMYDFRREGGTMASTMVLTDHCYK